MVNDSDYQTVAESFKKLKTAPEIEMVFSPIKGWVLLANLQLALRHPANNGASAEIGREFFTQLEKGICSIAPELGEIIEKGWNPRYDQNKEELGEMEMPATFPDPDIRSWLIRAASFDLAIACLAKVSGLNKEKWSVEIQHQAAGIVDKMTPEEIKQLLEPF